MTTKTSIVGLAGACRLNQYCKFFGGLPTTRPPLGMLTDTASIVSLSIHLGILILLFLIMLLGAFIGFKRLRGLTWAMFFIQLYGTCYSIQQCTETMIQVHQQLYSPDYPPDYDVYFGFGMFSSVLLVITLGISASCAYRGSTIVKLLLRRIRPLQ